MKLLWAIGIRDEFVLSVVGKILKSEIEGVEIVEKGVTQSGVISPLLVNAVLNELNWRIAGQWGIFQQNTNIKE